MARQILVPVDGSQKSLEGLEYAVTTYSNDDITVLSVMTPHGARNDGDQPFSQTDFENWYDEAKQEIDDILDEAQELASNHGAEITTEVDVGEPWRAIVEYAEENDIDHIIMGNHGRDDDLPLPSIASSRQSYCVPLPCLHLSIDNPELLFARLGLTDPHHRDR